MKDNSKNSTHSEYRQYLDLIGANSSNPYMQTLAREDVTYVFFDENGPRTEQSLQRAIKTYREVIRAKVDQLSGDQDFPKRQVSDLEKFKQAPRTRAKTAQDVLTAKPELQAFNREDVAEHGEESLIQSIKMDPRKITDSMLRNFGLDQYIPTGKGLSEDERMKMRAEAIPAIKDFLARGMSPLNYYHEENQRPEQHSYFRLSRITQGKNEGMLLGTQNNEGSRMFLTDVHSAFRRVGHIEDSYAKEMRKLHDIQYALDRIANRVASAWSEVRDGSEFEEIKAKLCGMVESLQFVKNPHKLKMKKSIERCLNFKDKKDRLNPMSRLAILAPVRAEIAKRIAESGRILGYLASDRVRLQNAIMEQTDVLSDFHDEVQKDSDKLSLLQPKKEITEVKSQRVVTNLTVLRNQCESMRFEPYLSLAKAIMEEIEGIVALLKSDKVNDINEREKAKKSFVMIYLVSKLLKLEKDLMELRDQFFAPQQSLENIYVKALIARIKEIEAEFKGKPVAPEVEIKEFSDIFGEVYKLLGEVRKTGEQSLRNGAPREQRVTALQEISARLKAFNPYGFISSQSQTK
ncbi:MAG: hypothetical protein PHP74_01355 [Candidatus Gracilibacteria bacterium]|nr:hypothetical protein [Candidatus Gracilibacteria bacterium]